MTYYFGLACNKSDLITVKILEEEYDSDNVCTKKEVIYRCRVCGGFYKHEYSATYYEDGWMGDDHGWMIDDHYYKIEEPYSGSIGALHEQPPLPLDVARAYGYTGEDYTWKNNRCNFASFYGELTCRPMDLRLVAYRESDARPHNRDKFHQCRRCGQWYLEKMVPDHKVFKPPSEHFPVEEAVKFGYDANISANSRQNNFLRSLLIVLFGAWMIFCPPAAFGLDPGKAPTQYIHDFWTTSDGLPQDTVVSIVQDGRGYIWLVTQEGIARFDGVGFTFFDERNTEAFKKHFYGAAFVDRRGSLSVGTGGGLLSYRNETFEFVGDENGSLPNAVVRNISEDAAGNLWFGFSSGDKREGGNGLARFKDGRTEIFTEKNGLASNQVKNTFSDREGNLWIATANGLNRFRYGKFTVYTTADGLSDNLVRTVSGDRAGNLWLGTLNGLNRFKDGKFTVLTTKDGLSNDSIRAVYEDRDGIIWVGTDAGLNRIVDGKIEAVGKIEGLGREEILSFLEDAEGSLWIGTHSAGLHRLRDGKFTVFGSPEGLLGDNVGAIFEDRDGRVLIGTNPGGLNVLDGGGRLATYSVADGLLSDKIRMINEDRGGAFWIGTRFGLNRFKDGKFTPFTVKDGLVNESVNAFHQTRDESIWIGTNGGLNRLTDGKFVNLPDAEKLSGKFIRPILEDRTGRVWLGMDEGTGYFKDGVFTAHPAEALNKANVQAILEDDEGVLWFGTWSQGLMRLKNEKLTVFKTESGLFDNIQWSVLDDGAGNLWMGSNRGIFRVSKQELDDYAEGRIAKVGSIVYGAADGLRKSEINAGGASAIRARRDGRLWFSTTAGAAVIDPKNIRINRVAPPVVLERVLIDQKEIKKNESAFIVPPGAKTVEFHYAGLSFIEPEKMLYKYKLEGFDTDWIDAGTRRDAFYTNLPPGDYQFKVIAANSDGVWNERGTSFGFTAEAPFWRTRWFYALVIFVIAGIVFLFYRWRVSKLQREKLAQQRFSQQLIESQEKERKRIASELHDGLGQSLVIIKNRAMLGLGTPENHEKLIAQMREISESVSAAITEVRGIARNLHPYQIEYLGLTGALKAMIKASAEASKIEFAIAVDDLAGTLSKEEEVNLYRIVQEAVNNTVKHSGATRAAVTLKNNSRWLDLSVEDNGGGFATNSGNGNGNGGGLGLVGMAERAKILNAVYEINSTEKGTSIRLQMPLGTRENEK